MKKYILVFLFSGLILHGNAQSNFSAGVRTGFSRNTLNDYDINLFGDESPTYGPIGGFLFGATAQYKLSKSFACSADLLLNSINNKNFKKATNFPNARLMYLDLPLMIKYRSQGVVGVYVEAGPQISFLLNGKEKIQDYTGIYPASITNNNTNYYFNKTLTAALLGFGIEVRASDKISLTAGVRITLGISKVTKDYNDASYMSQFSSENLISNNIIIGVLYNFPEKQKK
jgi:hypothetical protein